MLPLRFLSCSAHTPPLRLNPPAASAAILRIIHFAITLAFITPAFASAQVAPPPSSAAPDQPGLPRTLAVFDDPGALSTLFIERGASKFAAITQDCLSWSPTATNIYTLILAKQGVPRITPDKTLAITFRLPAGGSSLGLHLHGASESAPSHLVLVSRTAGERGLIRVYRTPIWPSGMIAATDLLPSAQVRIPAFPAGDWYRLVVTTQTGPAPSGTTLSCLLFAETSDTVVASLDARDPYPALPDAGLVAVRLFSPALGRIDVRALIAQP